MTRNPGKLAAAQSIFLPLGITLRPVSREYIEIQAATSLEVARYTACEAARELNASAIREDHSLFLNALRFPGPYTSYFEKTISPTLLLEMMKNFVDRSGYFEIATVLAEPSGKTHDFVLKVPIQVSLEERGNLQSGWARILMFEGDNRTFAEYSESERLHVWAKNYEAVAKMLLGKI